MSLSHKLAATDKRQNPPAGKKKVPCEKVLFLPTWDPDNGIAGDVACSVNRQCGSVTTSFTQSRYGRGRGFIWARFLAEANKGYNAMWWPFF
jgi:hypothetical protein